MEEQLLLPVENGSLFAVLYTPASAIRATALFFDPLLEERKTSQRPLVELARRLAEANVAVLRFDYGGCGDSSGDFAATSLRSMTCDALAAHAWLETRFPGIPRWLFGLRCGGALALSMATAAAKHERPYGLVLWEPVLDGHEYIMAELRKKLMKEMMTFGGNRTTREEMVRRLEEEGTVDLDGYPLTGTLFSEVASLRLNSELDDEPAQHVFHASISPSAGKKGETDHAGSGCAVSTMHFRMQSFWNQVGYVDCSHLIEETVSWLARLL